MSKLTDFLIENPVDGITKEIVVSKRLKDFPFTIKAMSGKEFGEYQKLATVISKGKKVSFNNALFNEKVAINHTTVPNFKCADDVKKAGCISPESYMYKVLTAGEIAELTSQISELSGFDADMDETVEEAKNS